MGTDDARYEPPSAQDYFSDNIQGRKQSDHARKSGPPASQNFVKAERKLCAFRKKKASHLGQRIFDAAVRKISESELNAQLDKLNIPRPDYPVGPQPVIRDSAFSFISELLRQFGQGEWALRPRTFCILRILGCIELMDSFIATKRTDAFLPYDDRNLPAFIKGADIRAKFLKLQELVLSSQHLNELEKGGSAHMNFRVSADDYFLFIKVLGQGGRGVVDRVLGTFSVKEFARKRIHRGFSALKDQDQLSSFEKELVALKAISHRHLVRLVSSYTDPVYVGLIMRPVADEDLKEYLARTLSSTSDSNARQQNLQTFFGCLISALEYLHHNRIHHMDIKPRNVLVKGTDVFLTDFGTARKLGEASRSFSTGVVDRTPTYCAPEVAKYGPWGKHSDIWSMGCVFLEMATVLNQRTIEEKDNFYLNHGTKSTQYWENEEATAEWLRELASGPSPAGKAPLDWIINMLHTSAKERWTASQVLSHIVDADAVNENHWFCFHCLDDQQSSVTRIAISQAAPSSELVTGTLLQSYMERNFNRIPGQDEEDEDTVTSKILEDAGVIRVAKEENESDDFRGDSSESEVDDTLLDDEGQSHSPKGQPPKTASGLPSPTLLEGHAAHRSESKEVRLRSKTFTSKSVAASSGSSTAFSPVDGASSPQLDKNSDSKVQPRSKQVRFHHQHDSRRDIKDMRQRFSGLDPDRRPSATDPTEHIVELDDTPIIPPEPLRPPPLDVKDCYPLPKATLVPSYILAGANRFTRAEVRASKPTWGTFNLFVYGRLMFPSFLHAFAARSIQGVYSPLHQRRLIPTSTAWARADRSVKHAVEAMTPARLKGYDKWKCSKTEFAAIQEASWTRSILRKRKAEGYSRIKPSPPGEVVGFLILGITEEALRYCDLVFSGAVKSLVTGKPPTGDNEKKKNDSTDDAKPISESPLQRQMVETEIQLVSGQYESVSAYTYIWTDGADQLRHPWTPESFVRGPMFETLSNVQSKDWRAEETSLADTMKIGYALVGDELCNAVLTDDIRELRYLLEDYHDVDALCRGYGTALQAAAAFGNEDMVRLLLNYGASPSAQGGKYGTPLIAATMGSRKTITKMLLKARADIFATNPQHVNALYQAVGHGDFAIAEMLLEAGAWLSTDYGEIKDLALERRDRDLQALLLKYDVQDPHYYRLQDRRNGRSMIKSSTRSVVKVVLKKVLILSTKSGSWRGHKGVEIVRAALAAGVTPSIVVLLRTIFNPVSNVIDIVLDTDRRNEQGRKRLKMKDGTGTLEESVSDVEEADRELVQLAHSMCEMRPDGDPTPSSPSHRNSGGHYSRPSSGVSVGLSRPYDSERRTRSRPKPKRTGNTSAHEDDTQLSYGISSPGSRKNTRAKYAGVHSSERYDSELETGGTTAGPNSARVLPTVSRTSTSTNRPPPAIPPPKWSPPPSYKSSAS